MSPYRAQCKFLQMECRKLKAEIAIGTAEIFQGQEKDVIIISTVQTKGDIGFVKDERVCTEVITVIC